MRKRYIWGISSPMVILVLFAMLLAKVIATGQEFSQLSISEPSFKNAQWLEYPTASEVLYARRDFNLDVNPDWASLTVAALDGFNVYLNGQRVGEKDLSGRYPVDVYDVSSMLKIGNNSLAIHAVSGQRSMNARIIAKLSWNVLGEQHNIASDRFWRVKKQESFQQHGSIAWYQNKYQISQWDYAKPVNGFSPKLDVGKLIPAHALKKLQLQNWAGVADVQSRHTNLSRSFSINAETIKGAWLGISVEGNYQLGINKMIFDGQTGSLNKMVYFPIASYLHPGENRIDIQLINAINSLAKIGVSGLVLSDSGEINFSVDNKWQCLPAPCHLHLFTRDYDQVPRLKAINQDTPKAFTWQQWTHWLQWWLLVFFSSMVLAGLFIPALMRQLKSDFFKASLIYSQPYALVSILLVVLLILDADPRFDFSSYYTVCIPGMVIMLTLLLLILPFIESFVTLKTGMQRD